MEARQQLKLKKKNLETRLMMGLNGKTGYLFLLTPLMASEQDPPAASGGRFMKGADTFLPFREYKTQKDPNTNLCFCSVT